MRISVEDVTSGGNNMECINERSKWSGISKEEENGKRLIRKEKGSIIICRLSVVHLLILLISNIQRHYESLKDNCVIFSKYAYQATVMERPVCYEADFTKIIAETKEKQN